MSTYSEAIVVSHDLNSHLESLIVKHSQNGLLLDSNLLLLLFVGLFNRQRIGSFKRLNAYTACDYDLLLFICRTFRRILTTPNILTEVSNLSVAFDGDLAYDYFGSFAAQLTVLQEQYVASTMATSQGGFRRLGLTDSVIMVMAELPLLVITADLDLTIHLRSLGLDVVNFTNLREWSDRED